MSDVRIIRWIGTHGFLFLQKILSSRIDIFSPSNGCPNCIRPQLDYFMTNGRKYAFDIDDRTSRMAKKASWEVPTIYSLTYEGVCWRGEGRICKNGPLCAASLFFVVSVLTSRAFAKHSAWRKIRFRIARVESCDWYTTLASKALVQPRLDIRSFL